MIQYTHLRPDYQISRIIKGNWQLSEGHNISDRTTAVEDLIKYAQTGFTTFDMADIYTGVEALFGEFLKKYLNIYGFDEAKKIKIHTKFVPNEVDLTKITDKTIETSINLSRKRLGKDKIDMIQFHWWDYEVKQYLQALDNLVRLQKKGLFELLSLTNFNTQYLNEINKSGVEIASNQVQYSLLDTRPQKKMSKFCLEKSIKLLCYGTLAGGFLTNKYLGLSEIKEPFENRSLRKYKLIIDEVGGWELLQALLAVLDKIARKHGCDIANIANAWVLAQISVGAIIVGSRNANHIASQLKTFEVELDGEDLGQIAHIQSQMKPLVGDCFDLERDKSSQHYKIMKTNLNSK